MALKILDLYQNSNYNDDRFKNNLNSSLHIVTDYEKDNGNYEWLELMESSIRYLDNILRNPNKFIVNEEDVIKIELAKRVTVESIKHLSRNTNFIQDYDKKTGDVRPSKILNISKEESFDTYENRLIYSLIQNMKFYVTKKKEKMGIVSSLKDYKRIEYRASNNINKEKIDIDLTFDSKLDDKGSSKMEEIQERIKKLEVQINGLCNSDVYKVIDKKHISLVTSPIKKTNVIIKNVNFQYAMKLWDFLQEHMADTQDKSKKENKDYYDNGKLKEYWDESFLLDYLIVSLLKGDEVKIDNGELSQKLVSNMVNKVMDINANIPLEELQKLVGEQYKIIKYKEVVSDKKIQQTFKKKIDRYLKRIEKVRI